MEIKIKEVLPSLTLAISREASSLLSITLNLLPKANADDYGLLGSIKYSFFWLEFSAMVDDDESE